MGIGDILSGIGSGIADTVTDIGTGIADAADLVFTVGEDVVGDVFGWTDEVLSGNDWGMESNPHAWGDAGPSVNQGWGMESNPHAWGADQTPTTPDAPVSNATFASPSASTAGGGMLSGGGFFTKDDIKGAAAGFARGYFEKRQADEKMDWRRELELERIASQKKHHGAYYVGSDVRPAYAKPLEKK